MAGVKGRSGGARPGSGRKRKPENVGADTVASTPKATPLEVLQAMMNDASVPVAQRIKAAQAAAPYVHAKIGEGGKKDAAVAKAKAVAGKFSSPPPPPRLVSSK